MPTLYSGNGAPLLLGPQLGVGGEGAVYEIADRDGLVAKLYHQPVDAAKAQKLASMALASSPDLLRVAAWPVDLVRVNYPNGPVRGIVMPRITNYAEAHTLYGPKQRQNNFSNADWRFLIWTAQNAARAMQAVHSAGFVMGDVNQKNFMIGRDATVRLIDCDSFQATLNGKTFYCLVGVPEFTPPELHGQPFDRTLRTPNHDNFGLAVLIFHFLFMGRHPFAGRYHGPGDMPPDKAIRELRFAYSQTAATKQIVPPPHALSLSAASFAVAGLFERAFGTAGVHGKRPTASEWISALDGLKQELKRCVNAPGHWYHKSLADCPWCVIERGGGPDFFISVTATVGAGTPAFDLVTVWDAITRVAIPRGAPTVEPSISIGTVIPKPLPEAVRNRRRTATTCLIVGIIAAAIALTGFLTPVLATLAVGLALSWGLLRTNPEFRQESQARRDALGAAEHRWKANISEWRTNIDAAVNRFRSLRAELEGLYNEYKRLPALVQQEHAALFKNREGLQRKAFLERFYIRDATLPGIGNGLKATLQSEGVETAFDVTPGMRVPGIGEARMSTLLGWRSRIEVRFSFDPGKGISRTDTAAIDSKFAKRRHEIERRLGSGVKELARLQAYAQQQENPPQKLADAARALAQARADKQLA